MVGPGWLVHASDHPHAHGPGTEAVLDVLDEAEAAAVLRGTAQELYDITLSRNGGGQGGGTASSAHRGGAPSRPPGTLPRRGEGDAP